MDNECKSPVPSVVSNDFNTTILHTLEARLRCDICYNAYNTSVRAPTTLICGHTFCNKCINDARHSRLAIRCFVCFRNTAAKPSHLDKNWLLTNLLEELFPATNTAESLPSDVRPDSSNVAVKALDDEDSDDDSDADFCDPSQQLQVFNRISQLVYDELFELDQTLNRARTDTQHDFTEAEADAAAMQDTVAQSLLRMHETFVEVKQVRQRLRHLLTTVNNTRLHANAQEPQNNSAPRELELSVFFDQSTFDDMFQRPLSTLGDTSSARWTTTFSHSLAGVAQQHGLQVIAQLCQIYCSTCQRAFPVASGQAGIPAVLQHVRKQQHQRQLHSQEPRSIQRRPPTPRLGSTQANNAPNNSSPSREPRHNAPYRGRNNNRRGRGSQHLQRSTNSSRPVNPSVSKNNSATVQHHSPADLPIFHSTPPADVLSPRPLRHRIIRAVQHSTQEPEVHDSTQNPDEHASTQVHDEHESTQDHDVLDLRQTTDEHSATQVIKLDPEPEHANTAVPDQ